MGVRYNYVQWMNQLVATHVLFVLVGSAKQKNMCSIVTSDDGN